MRQNTLQAPILLRSVKSWSLYLQEITFHPDFGRLINKLFDRSEKVGYITISFDYSGYFPKAKLNLNISEDIHVVRAGDTIDFDHYGLEIFPEKKVDQEVSAAFILFHTKMNIEEFEVFKQAIQELIEQSDLYRNVNSNNLQKEFIKKGGLEKMTDLLLFEIQCAINNSKAQHISTQQFKNTVKEEWSYFGFEEIQKQKVKLKILKKSC